MVRSVTTVLSLLTIGGQIIVGLALIFVILAKFFHIKVGLWVLTKKRVAKSGLLFALIVALMATLGSLFYSEVALYPPCKLCWYQRIFMYPMVVLLWVAIIRGFSREIRSYCIGLSLVGVTIATYHYYLQRFGDSSVPCSTVGISESCATREFLYFGYVTIPLMAWTAFLLIMLFMVLFKRRS